MFASMIRIPALLLFCLTAVAGCNQSNNAELAKAKAEAEAARTELAQEKVKAVAAETELAKTKTTPVPPQAPEPDRRAAEWVLRAGGIVRITSEGIASEYPKDGKLPEGEFEVVEVNLAEPAKNKSLTNDGVKNLAGLKHLTVLILNGPGVTDFQFLNGMERLDYVQLNESGITDSGLAHIKNLAKLQTLHLEHFFGNKEITDVGMESLKNLKGLVALTLWGANITDAGLDHVRGLTNLKLLRLGRSPITDSGLARLKDLTNLRELHLIDTQITDSAFEILKGHPNLEVLNLEGTKVTDAGVNAFMASRPMCRIDGRQKN